MKWACMNSDETTKPSWRRIPQRKKHGTITNYQMQMRRLKKKVWSIDPTSPVHQLIKPIRPGHYNIIVFLARWVYCDVATHFSLGLPALKNRTTKWKSNLKIAIGMDMGNLLPPSRLREWNESQIIWKLPLDDFCIEHWKRRRTWSSAREWLLWRMFSCFSQRFEPYWLFSEGFCSRSLGILPSWGSSIDIK